MTRPHTWISQDVRVHTLAVRYLRAGVFPRKVWIAASVTGRSELCYTLA